MVDIRLDSVVDLDLFKHLHRAGLRRVFIGVETGSYEQLRAYRKQILTRGQDAADTINALQQLGIDVIPGTIMFHPPCSPTSYAKQSACCGQQSIRSASSS